MYGYEQAHVSVGPTLLTVALREGDVATVRTIDSFKQLRLDQSSEVIAVARAAQAGELPPGEALRKLEHTLASSPASEPSHASRRTRRRRSESDW